MKTLEQIKSESVGADRFRSTLMGVFGGVALLLSAIGLYGVVSYSVVQRTREIGVRTALGANSVNILGLILRSGIPKSYVSRRSRAARPGLAEHGLMAVLRHGWASPKPRYGSNPAFAGGRP